MAVKRKIVTAVVYINDAKIGRRKIILDSGCKTKGVLRDGRQVSKVGSKWVYRPQ